ncbi:MAG: hypothetical protein Q9M39_04070 [Sulfurovum sp.]|nr:hypothetical protein [Sulfurovum sp.]
MKSKIIYVVLFMLTFSALHDSFIPLLDTSENMHSIQYAHDDVSSLECTEYSEMHSMFHFMAIVSSTKNMPVHFAKHEIIPHLVVQHTPPLISKSYKPPIA